MSEMTDEVPTEVVEEHVPPIKWPERVIVYKTTAGLEFMAIPIDNIDIEGQYVTELRQTGRSYRILRVQPPTPPKKQRVVFDWPAVCVEGYGFSMKQMESIERHARIVDEEVQP